MKPGQDNAGHFRVGEANAADCKSTATRLSLAVQRACQRVLQSAVWGALILALPYPASANVITLTAMDPKVPDQKMGFSAFQLKLKSKTIILLPNGKTEEATDYIPGPQVGAQIAPGDTAANKTAKLFKAMMEDTGAFGEAVKEKQITNPTATTITFQINTADRGVSFGSTGTPGETRDALTSKDDPTAAVIEFQGQFDSLDPSDQPSIFTAGISSDLTNSIGLTDSIVTLTSTQILDSGAGSLNGVTVADALFDALSKIVPSGLVFGHVNDASTEDGMIVANYPQGTASSNGGITFGTSSFDGTVDGTIDAVLPEPSSLALLLASLIGMCFARKRGHHTKVL